MNQSDPRQMIPVSIMVAGIIIAGAIYFGGRTTAPSGNLTGNNAAATVGAVGDVAPVTSKDHVLGDPSTAKLVIVEYTDLECPFCKAFHATMHDIMTKYNGQVAWVIRHFPIAQLHSKAPKEAEASECAFDQGGNTAFWQFVDKVFEITTSNNTLDPAQLPIIAGQIGLDVSAFNTCLSSGKHTSEIQADVAAATKAGAQGTPYSVIISRDGKKTPINGAQPEATVISTIDGLLK